MTGTVTHTGDTRVETAGRRGRTRPYAWAAIGTSLMCPSVSIIFGILGLVEARREVKTGRRTSLVFPGVAMGFAVVSLVVYALLFAEYTGTVL